MHTRFKLIMNALTMYVFIIVQYGPTIEHLLEFKASPKSSSVNT